MSESPDHTSPELALEIIDQMIEAADRISRRGKSIQAAEDFKSSETGLDAMDGIMMMIIVLGESVKKLEKVTSASLFDQYHMVDWKGIKGMRDVLSHEYFGVNPYILYDVVKNKIPTLIVTLKAIRDSLATDP